MAYRALIEGLPSRAQRAVRSLTVTRVGLLCPNPLQQATSNLCNFTCNSDARVVCVCVWVHGASSVLTRVHCMRTSAHVRTGHDLEAVAFCLIRTREDGNAIVGSDQCS